jgi:formate transporter
MTEELVADAKKKIGLPTGKLVVLSFLCTPFLAYATALCALLVAQGWGSAAAGLLFPVGYVMLAILGLEMVTGSFSVVAIGLRGRALPLSGLARNWTITFLGNLAGGVFFALLLWFALTRGGTVEPPAMLHALASTASKKVSYRSQGALGWFAAVGMGMLCNWLVSVAPILAKAARNVPGKVILMWLPIATFFALGFEHSVVNMFVLPVGMLSGAPVTLGEWWWWNQIPVTIGNILAAVFFNATLWHGSHRVRRGDGGSV